MFCNKCGKNNSDDAVYCQKCGALLEGEDETVVAQRPKPGAVTGNDEQIVTVGPTLKFVKLGYVLAVLGAFIFAGLISLISTTPWIPVLVGLALLLIPAFYHIRQRLVRYTLTPTMIEIDRGVISRTTQNVPLRRIQDVTVSSSAIQRLLGFGDVIVDNASEDGGKVVVKNIDAPRKFADELLKHLRKESS
ncbi:MAG TPA: PH domain-containing protein [Pyrinomonadaceae bacterium]|nr:PH domain-containing protein [Pyrinomonadaceae bacterium]